MKIVARQPRSSPQVTEALEGSADGWTAGGPGHLFQLEQQRSGRGDETLRALGAVRSATMALEGALRDAEHWVARPTRERQEKLLRSLGHASVQGAGLEGTSDGPWAELVEALLEVLSPEALEAMTNPQAAAQLQAHLGRIAAPPVERGLRS
ncbi:MAG: hypothetical protein U1E65_32580 [Myxococcota bacterium]